MAKKKKMASPDIVRVVAIKWLDASGSGSDRGTVDLEPLYLWTYGAVYHEDEETITLAMEHEASHEWKSPDNPNIVWRQVPNVLRKKDIVMIQELRVYGEDDGETKSV